MINLRLIFLYLVILAFYPLLSYGQPPLQPQQNLSGPGGKEYQHQEVRHFDFGKKMDGFWLFEPARPCPKKAPVIVFMHGYGAYNPMVYGQWIDHLVRKGNIVIFPRYQKRYFVPSVDKFIPNTVKAIKEAFLVLDSGNHVQPDLKRFSMVGHSFGGAIIAHILADSNHFGLPEAQAAMLVSPGTGPWKRYPFDSYASIPEDIFLLLTVSDGDPTVRDVFANKVFETAIHTPNRNLIRQFGDDYGYPAITDSHNESYAPHPDYDKGLHGYSYRKSKRLNFDVVDYNGYWKLLDALNDCAWTKEHCHYAFGNTPEQRSLGFWSDGTPIKAMEITLPPSKTQLSIKQ